MTGTFWTGLLRGHEGGVRDQTKVQDYQGSGKLLRLLRILVDKSKSRGQFWSETTRKASGQIVSGQ